MMKELFTLMGVLSAIMLQGQWLNDLHANEFSGVIRQPDEFIELMNAIPESRDSVELISSLFNIPELRKNSVPDSAVALFAQSLVRRNTINVDLEEGNWLAVIRCKMVYKETETSVTFLLSFMEDSAFTFPSWRITGAEFNNLSKESQRLTMISPTSHNMDFLQFRKNILYEGADIRSMVHTGYDFDELTYLSTLYEVGLLEFISIEEICLRYNNLGGYAFEITRLRNGTDYRSWAISNLNFLVHD